MSLIDKIKNIYKKCEDTLFKNYSCIGCGKEVSTEEDYFLCNDCKNSLSKIDGKVCQKCGDMLNANSMVCELCKSIDYNFESNKSCFYYDETAGTIIKSFKYGGRRYYAKTIAKLMFDSIKNFDSINKIVYVPIGKKKRKLRGFNQSELISKELSKLTNIEVIEALTKDDTKVSQAGLNREERLKNLSGTFHLNSDIIDKIKNQNILIIDDVFTTGSTLSECAKEIKKAKPKTIKTLTFAKTKLNSLN